MYFPFECEWMEELQQERQKERGESQHLSEIAKVIGCHDITVLVVTVLNVLHLAKILNRPWPAHSGHACLIEKGTSSRFDDSHMRLNQAIALRVMGFAEVVLPFRVAGSCNQSFIIVRIEAPYLDIACKTSQLNLGSVSILAFGRFAIEVARSNIEDHQAVNVISNSYVVGVTVENKSAVIVSPKRSAL